MGDTMRACFHPEGDGARRMVSGTGRPAFSMKRSNPRKKRRPGEGSKHLVRQFARWVKGDRALLESDAMVQGRTTFTATICSILRSNIRLYDRLERRQANGASCAWMRSTTRTGSIRCSPARSRRDFFTASICVGRNRRLALMKWRLEKRGGKLAELPLGGTRQRKKIARTKNEAWLAGA